MRKKNEYIGEPFEHENEKKLVFKCESSKEGKLVQVDKPNPGTFIWVRCPYCKELHGIYYPIYDERK